MVPFTAEVVGRVALLARAASGVGARCCYHLLEHWPEPPFALTADLIMCDDTVTLVGHVADFTFLRNVVGDGAADFDLDVAHSTARL